MTNGAYAYFDFSSFIPAGSALHYTTGATVQLSSTMGTGTLVGAYLSAGGVAV